MSDRITAEIKLVGIFLIHPGHGEDGTQGRRNITPSILQRLLFCQWRDVRAVRVCVRLGGVGDLEEQPRVPLQASTNEGAQCREGGVPWYSCSQLAVCLCVRPFF